MAHDITADRSPLGRPAHPAEIRNFRAPRADLEGVYGTGPIGAPYLYARSDPAHGWTGETPLWLYVLKEAHALHDGLRLGPVGGRIVGEVLVAIVDADPASFRSLDPGWTPAPFGLADVLVPSSRA